MFTQKRLTQAYKNAKVEYFDKDSRYIFFSDCHRGDDSASDEFAKNQHVFLHALDYYYNKGYKYVEVGDGDELWEYTDFNHIRLAHTDVFLGMKKFSNDNRLIFLFGNHNIYLKKNRFVKKNYFSYYDEYNQKKQSLFTNLTPHEAIVLKHRETGQEILVVHGHQGDLMNDQLWYISMLMLRYIWRFLHVVGLHSPASPAKNLYKRHKIEKNYKVWIIKNKRMLICGHTHRPHFPKTSELPYYNTGCCVHSKGLTGIEIINDTILMVEWRIKADDNGSLNIVRTVVRGPEKICKYKMDNFPCLSKYFNEVK